MLCDLYQSKDYYKNTYLVIRFWNSKNSPGQTVKVFISVSAQSIIFSTIVESSKKKTKTIKTTVIIIMYYQTKIFKYRNGKNDDFF